MTRWIPAAALLGLAVLPVLSAVAQAQASGPTGSSGAMFGARENVQQIDVSPDGTRVVYLTPGSGRTTEVRVADLEGGVPAMLLRANGDPERVHWCRFASNTRLICRVMGQISNVGVLVPYARLFAVDIDGKNVKPLGQRSSFYDARSRQFDGDILDWLPGEDGAVLMARDYVPETGKTGSLIVRKADGLGVDRVNVSTMASKTVEFADNAADTFISDGRGNVRIKAYTTRRGESGLLTGRINYHYRLLGSKAWTPFSSWEDGEGMVPIAVDEQNNAAYVLKKLDGRVALYRVKLDGTLASELVYQNEKVDVDGVVRLGRSARVIGVTFAEEKRHVIYFDPEYEKLAASLGRALPDLPIVDFLAASADHNTLLIHAGSDSDPGRYYVYKKAERVLNEILLARPALEDVALASVKPITYPAKDGTAIPAYLTLPPGREARGLPAVVLPHGGPSARDEWGFDWLAQFLAHQGYAVIQPNYRGSTGYGDAWLQANGFRSWRTSIGDVTAAGRWLVAQGIASPGRLAIVGWSYGGYAALQSSVIDPDLFKAIVAIAPVTDLDLLKKEARDYTNARNVADFIGSGAHVAQGSPLQNVDAIRAPVLMFHGSMDVNVGVRHARVMEAKLRAAGKPVDLVVFEGLEHSLIDSTARADMLDRISTFLARHVEQ